MVERIQDLNLPNSNITKIIKDSLPADVNMDKEARIAIARATSVFIMYLSSNAAALAQKQNHKTFSAQDVLDSINEMDFKSFTGPMKSASVIYQKSMRDKKNSKKNSLEICITQQNQQTGQTPAASISPSKPGNHKADSYMQTSNLSPDIIEIDDSD